MRLTARVRGVPRLVSFRTNAWHFGCRVAERFSFVLVAADWSASDRPPTQLFVAHDRCDGDRRSPLTFNGPESCTAKLTWHLQWRGSSALFPSRRQGEIQLLIRPVSVQSYILNRRTLFAGAFTFAMNIMGVGGRSTFIMTDQGLLFSHCSVRNRCPKPIISSHDFLSGC